MPGLPLAHLRTLLESLGFSGAVLIGAGDAAQFGGLNDLAQSVRLGLVRADQPEVVADRDPGGGWPTVRVAVALDPADAQALLDGDRVTALDVADMLLDAYDAFMDQARAGKLN